MIALLDDNLSARADRDDANPVLWRATPQAFESARY
jgi:hypothetical protein